MSAHCNHHTPAAHTLQNPARYRRVLWVALVVNAAMFAVEVLGSMGSGSLALLADSVDFAGDAMNYGLSLAVLGAALSWRARAAQLKAVSMLGFGLYVLGSALWSLWHGDAPNAVTMGLVGVLALLANVGVAWLLYAYRDGDANMRSVWLCSRNDAIGNVAVMLAALGVFGTGSAWPDLLVATLMALLALHGAWQVLRQAGGELAGHSQGHDHSHDHSHAHTHDHHH
ncbi:cation transporter [Curvibacter sp. CHRR-16]|uniref:cation transporter n=1 Tax=Curvibacter sp. CHRR-16 TaxID=2835872 RepID=UPI001BDABF1C|nr:cation diffusion facilitator family transporter [Curvibacter sp. CHRR-16]MBT0570242.1 cation transporter [Curvibacter sp. CHRR-16]